MARLLPGTRALRTLEAAARHLNFTRAAHELGLTPAAVSHQIKEIEDQLGIVLFTRTSRTIRLTEAGAVLFEASTDALDLLGRAVSRAHKLARGTALLKVTLDAQFATKWLMRRVDDFRKQRPGIELRFDIASELRDFDLDDVDVGIRFGAGKYPDFAPTGCSTTSSSLCAAPACWPPARRCASHAISSITRSPISSGRDKA